MIANSFSAVGSRAAPKPDPEAGVAWRRRGAVAALGLAALALAACAAPGGGASTSVQAGPVTNAGPTPSPQPPAPADAAPAPQPAQELELAADQTVALEAAPADTGFEAPSAAPAVVPAPRAPAGALRRSRGFGGPLDFATPADVRLLLLRRAEQEPPEAVFYGYMIIGAEVSPDRKAAVARALACRIDAVGSADAAAQIDLLGVMAVPARESASADVISPGELLDSYDFPRAGRWLEAAGRSVDVAFNPQTAIIFVGSRAPRAGEMDALAVFRAPNDADPLIADASALSPRYLERWAYELVQGVRGGRVQSRQDMQRLMEVHSWIEMIGEPFAALMRLAPSAEAQDFSAPTCL